MPLTVGSNTVVHQEATLGSVVRLGEVAIDEATSVPSDLFARFLAVGAQARARGQHQLRLGADGSMLLKSIGIAEIPTSEKTPPLPTLLATVRAPTAKHRQQTGGASLAASQSTMAAKASWASASVVSAAVTWWTQLRDSSWVVPPMVDTVVVIAGVQGLTHSAFEGRLEYFSPDAEDLV